MSEPDLNNGVLSGLKVLDFGRYIAGPYCATLLAEFGADVIRIEKREGSEDRFTAPVTPDGMGALFLQIARNKRSMTLNPMHPDAKPVIETMVKEADIVVANLPAKTMKRMGLDYETLSAINPRIILTTSNSFGTKGEWSNRVGFDGVGQVMAGGVYMTGEERQPYRAQVPWVDFTTALHCAYGTLIAVMARQQTGRGQMVTGSLLASAVTLNNAMLIEQAVTQVNRVPTGNRGQTSAPVDIYQTKDGSVLVQVVGQPLFDRVANLIGEPGWLQDERFATDDLRGQHGELISARMQQWCDELTTEQALTKLGDAMIPCAPVLKPQETLDHPAVQDLGILTPTEYPGIETPAPLAKVPVGLTETGGGIRQRPPQIGEHTDEVLKEFGYDDAAISSLRDAKVI
jgi:crotonobetainyl-CoA:carnitine CoA-transferase CaiB-like acyl-CoA transferase